MFQLTKLTLCSLLLAVFAYQHIFADPYAAAPTDCPPEGNGTEPGGNGTGPGGNGTDSNDDDDDRDGQDSLCQHFQDLRALIPKDTLVDLIQSHYECNSKFRRALKYYKTARFRQMAELLQQSQAFADMLDELRDQGVDTKAIENVLDIFSCIELPVPKGDHDCDCRAIRGHSFVSDVLAAMPKQQVHDYVSQAEGNGTNFGQFARALTSPELQLQLRANLMKRDVSRPLRTLRHNGWDIPELLRSAKTILSW